jgi:electron transfer flavoprotein alpha subunit
MAGEIWCVAEQRRGQVPPGVLEALSGAKKLAGPMGAKVAAVLIGSGVKDKAKDLGERGADRVIVVDDAGLANYNDDLQPAVLAKLIEAEKPAVVLVPSSVLGKSLANRAAPLAKMGLAADVSDFKFEGGAVKAVRACCGGVQLVEVTAKGPLMATVAKGAFARAEAQAGRAFETKELPASLPAAKLKFVSFAADEGDAKDIGQVDVIVSGGYGLGKKEGFQLLEELAKLLGGAVGASRRVVDSGWIPYRHQVGLTGRTVKPKLYIACGISGQIQHLAGMGQSDTIVAINTDKEAPLMKIATYAVPGDIFEVVPALIAEIKKDRNGS